MLAFIATIIVWSIATEFAMASGGPPIAAFLAVSPLAPKLAIFVTGVAGMAVIYRLALARGWVQNTTVAGDTLTMGVLAGLQLARLTVGDGGFPDFMTLQNAVFMAVYIGAAVALAWLFRRAAAAN